MAKSKTSKAKYTLFFVITNALFSIKSELKINITNSTGRKKTEALKTQTKNGLKVIRKYIAVNNESTAIGPVFLYLYF